jgi:hypothetical protein
LYIFGYILDHLDLLVGHQLIIHTVVAPAAKCNLLFSARACARPLPFAELRATGKKRTHFFGLSTAQSNRLAHGACRKAQPLRHPSRLSANAPHPRLTPTGTVQLRTILARNDALVVAGLAVLAALLYFTQRRILPIIKEILK